MPINPIIIKDAPEELRPFLVAADDINGSDDLKGVLRTKTEIEAVTVHACAPFMEKAGDGKNEVSGYAKRCLETVRYLEDKSRQKMFSTSYFGGYSLIFLGNATEAFKYFGRAERLATQPQESLMAYAAISGAAFDLGDYQNALLYLDKAIKISPGDTMLHLGKADSLVALGRRKEAVNVLDKVLALDPKNIMALSKKASLLSTDVNTFNDALSCYLKLKDLVPPDQTQLLAQIYAGIGIVYGNQDKHSLAVEMFEKALAIDPTFIDAQILHANAIYYSNRQEEALDELRKVAAQNPDAWRAYERLGFLLTESHRYREAAEAYEKALKLNPKIGWMAAKFDYRFGVALRSVGQYEKSLHHLKLALKLAENKEEYSFIETEISSTLLFIGQNNEAMKHAETAVKLNPKSGFVWSQMSSCLLTKDRVDEALKAAEKAIELEPENAEVHRAMAEILFKSRKMADALVHYEECIKRIPEDAQMHARMAHLFLEMGRIDEAEAAADRALKIDPDRWRAQGVKGVVLALRGRGEEGLILFDKAMKHPDFSLSGREKSEAVLRAWRGIALLALDRDEDALKELNTVFNIAFKLGGEVSPQVYNNIGVALTKLGRVDEAVESFKKAGDEYFSSEVDIYSRVGRTLLESGKVDEAIKYFKKALEVDPKAVDILRGLGVLYLGMGKLDEAEGYLKRVIEIDPDYSVAYSELGVIKGRRGKFDEALALFDKAIAHDNEKLHGYLGYFYYNKASILIQTNRPDEALAVIETYLGINPKDADIYFLMGAAYLQKDDNAKAIASLDEAIKRKPNYVVARLFRAGLFASENKFSEALAELDEVTKFDPNNVMGHLIKGLILFVSTKKYEDAINPFKKLIELVPQDMMGYYYLGRVNFSLGQNDTALTWVDVALAKSAGLSDPYLLKARILLKLGRYAEARAALKRAVDIGKFVDSTLPMITDDELDQLKEEVDKSEEFKEKLDYFIISCQQMKGACEKMKKGPQKMDCLQELKLQCGLDTPLSLEDQMMMSPRMPSVEIGPFEFEWFKFKEVKKNPLEQGGPYIGPFDAPAFGPMAK